MPADTNANGDIFGGWLMSQMDIGGAILAKEIAHGRVVTVRVEGMTFLRPVAVGDVVCCYARCVKRGTTSISINIEVWVKKSRQNRLDSATRPPRRCLFMLPSIRTVNLARSRFRVKYTHLRRQQVMVYSRWRRQRLLNLRRTVQTEDNIDHQPGTRLACFIAPFSHRILNFTLKHIGWLRG